LTPGTATVASGTRSTRFSSTGLAGRDEILALIDALAADAEASPGWPWTTQGMLALTTRAKHRAQRAGIFMGVSGVWIALARTDYGQATRRAEYRKSTR
jgi:hypothetical protein